MRDTHIRVAEKTIQRLKADMESLAQDVESYMAAHGCAQPTAAFACAEGGAANDFSRFSDLLEESVSVQNGLFSALGDRREDIQESNRWGSYWLHVGRSRR